MTEECAIVSVFTPRSRRPARCGEFTMKVNTTRAPRQPNGAVVQTRLPAEVEHFQLLRWIHAAGRRGRRGASWAARSWCKYSISFSYQWKLSCLDTCTAVIGVSHDLHIIWRFKIPFFCILNKIFLLLTRVFLARNNSVNPCLKLPILHLPVVKMADRGFSRQQWERHKTRHIR